MRGRDRWSIRTTHTCAGRSAWLLAPNGDLITANGDAVNPDPTQTSELVEFTPGGKFVGEFSLDPNAGGAFGLAATDTGGILRLAAVDDNTNSLDVSTFQTGGKSSAHRDFAALSPTAPAVLPARARTAAPARNPRGGHPLARWFHRRPPRSRRR